MARLITVILFLKKTHVYMYKVEQLYFFVFKCDEGVLPHKCKYNVIQSVGICSIDKAYNITLNSIV